ncbi:hypothetical protein HZS_4722, partial [Henneguya salminicola]
MPKVCFILGPPGSGKGTASDFLTKKYGMIHLSAGELLRKEMEKMSDIGNKIRKDMLSNRIVSSKITISLIESEMKEKGCNNTFVIDGFPRNIENLTEWNLQTENKIEIICVLLLECDK